MDKPSIRIQVVLYNQERQALDRLLSWLLKLEGDAASIELSLGDNGENPAIVEPDLREWRLKFGDRGIGWRYVFFGENLGFGAAHNRMAKTEPKPSCFLFLNPDTYAPPSLISSFVDRANSTPGFGILEARQVPLEHPKAFNNKTFETEWCSAACALVDGNAFQQVGGFDEIFFMYGEDVDLSWRIKALGKKLIYCPDNWVYHAKKLDRNGIRPGSAEILHSSLATLILLKKYGKSGALEQFRLSLIGSPLSDHGEAARKFLEIEGNIAEASPAERSAATFGRQNTLGHRRWEYVQADAARRDLALWKPS